MIKIFCDNCGAEDATNTFKFAMHLKYHDSDYVDSYGNATSGRIEEAHLCNKCYNELLGPVVKQILNFHRT